MTLNLIDSYGCACLTVASFCKGGCLVYVILILRLVLEISLRNFECIIYRRRQGICALMKGKHH